MRADSATAPRGKMLVALGNNPVAREAADRPIAEGVCRRRRFSQKVADSGGGFFWDGQYWVLQALTHLDFEGGRPGNRDVARCSPASERAQIRVSSVQESESVCRPLAGPSYQLSGAGRIRFSFEARPGHVSASMYRASAWSPGRLPGSAAADPVEASLMSDFCRPGFAAVRSWWPISNSERTAA